MSNLAYNIEFILRPEDFILDACAGCTCPRNITWKHSSAHLETVWGHICIVSGTRDNPASETTLLSIYMRKGLPYWPSQSWSCVLLPTTYIKYSNVRLFVFFWVSFSHLFQSLWALRVDHVNSCFTFSKKKWRASSATLDHIHDTWDEENCDGIFTNICPT